MSPVNGPILVSLALTLLCLMGLVSFLTDFAPGRAKMTYMLEYPQFVRISNTFDVKYQKYGLYAYSEGRLTEKARNLVFDGIPVLFLPGSMGSHKQCRSLASIALRTSINSKSRVHFDFFTVDLNQEISGLFGPVLNDQLAYINASLATVLELYEKSPNPPKKVVLVGHSMGGVLAKALVTQLGDKGGLVAIVITLAAPLTRPVVALDYGFQYFYTKMTRARAALENTTLISLAGGFNDFMMPPFLTDDGDLRVATTQVPKCWLSTDHLSIVWCKQLLLAINAALFACVNTTTMQLTGDKKMIYDVFYHHLIANDGRRLGEERKVERTQLTHEGDWFQSISRQYYAQWKKGVHENKWYLVPLVMRPQHEFLVAVGLNVPSSDWVYVCAAVNHRRNQRYCEEGNHLTHRTEIAPSLHSKRRILRINLHDVQMNYTSATHVAIKLAPTDDFVGLHIDVANAEDRQLTFDQGPSLIPYWPTELIDITEEKAISYEILLPQLTQVIQSYTLHVNETCTNSAHHATASLIIPWSHHEIHKFHTNTLQETLTFKLYKAKPFNETESAFIRLTLDPTCRYRVRIESNYALGMFVRFYMPMTIAHAAAVLLLILKTQLTHLARNEPCPFVITALKEVAKPYLILPIVKIISRIIDTTSWFDLPPTDNTILANDNMNMFFLYPILFYVGIGIVWLFFVTLTISLIFFESAIHRLGVKFLFRTFGTRIGWTDYILKAFEKVPGVVATILMAMSFSTCGGLAICLATIFYFLKLAQMSQDSIEELVKRIAKAIFFRFRDVMWTKIMPYTDRLRFWRSNAISRGRPSVNVNDPAEQGENVPLQASDENGMNEELFHETFDINWLRDAFANAEIFFHMTIFSIYCLVAVLNVPSVITWARNYKYSKSLEWDPIFIPAMIMSACTAVLWQFEMPRVDRKYYSLIAKLITVAAVYIMIYGVVSIYRISGMLSIAVGIVTLHQMVAPRNTQGEAGVSQAEIEDTSREEIPM